MVAASRRRTKPACLNRFSPPKHAASDWGWQSRGKLLSGIMGKSVSRAIRGLAHHSPLSCLWRKIVMNTSKVLVVDDEPAIRHFLVRVLERGGYEVTAAINGQQALQMLQSDHFDLLL